jgi:hypothetical protein
MLEDPSVTYARACNDAQWAAKLESRLAARKQARLNGETQVSAHRRTLSVKFSK